MQRIFRMVAFGYKLQKGESVETNGFHRVSLTGSLSETDDSSFSLKLPTQCCFRFGSNINSTAVKALACFAIYRPMSVYWPYVNGAIAAGQ